MELFGSQFEKIQEGPSYDGGSPINWALYSLFNYGIQISRPSATYEKRVFTNPRKRLRWACCAHRDMKGSYCKDLTPHCANHLPQNKLVMGNRDTMVLRPRDYGRSCTSSNRVMMFDTFSKHWIAAKSNVLNLVCDASHFNFSSSKTQAWEHRVAQLVAIQFFTHLPMVWSLGSLAVWAGLSPHK